VKHLKDYETESDYRDRFHSIVRFRNLFRIKGMYMQLVINYSKYKTKIMIVLNSLTELIAYFRAKQRNVIT
jgi:hypothetical protein